MAAARRLQPLMRKALQERLHPCRRPRPRRFRHQQLPRPALHDPRHAGQPHLAYPTLHREQGIRSDSYLLRPDRENIADPLFAITCEGQCIGNPRPLRQRERDTPIQPGNPEGESARTGGTAERYVDGRAARQHKRCHEGEINLRFMPAKALLKQPSGIRL